MTLQQFLGAIAERPILVLYFYFSLVVITLAVGFLGRNIGHLSPWKYIYAVLVYAAIIPGMFAITLGVYMFLFERRSILDMNIITQILPVMMTIVILSLIRRNVYFDHIPGFDKISGFIMITLVLLMLMWIVDRMHIIAFTYLPFHVVLVFLVIMLLVVSLGLKKLFS